MTTSGIKTSVDDHVADTAESIALTVRTCSRLGRTANPPRFWLRNLFSLRRRR